MHWAGPYKRRRKGTGSAIVGGGYGKASWGLSDECLTDIVGASGRLPPPPPAPPSSSSCRDLVGWGTAPPAYPPKARPQPPDFSPPNLKVEDVQSSVKSEVGEVLQVEVPDYFMSVSPDPPPLNSVDRADFVQFVKGWLRSNFSYAELEDMLA